MNGVLDKRLIPATFMMVLFLSVQLILDSKTDRSILQVGFPSTISKDFKFEKEPIKWFREIITPYIKI